MTHEFGKRVGSCGTRFLVNKSDALCHPVQPKHVQAGGHFKPGVFLELKTLGKAGPWHVALSWGPGATLGKQDVVGADPGPGPVAAACDSGSEAPCAQKRAILQTPLQQLTLALLQLPKGLRQPLPDMSYQVQDLPD